MHRSIWFAVPFALLSSLPLSGQISEPPRLDGHWEGVIVAVSAEMEADVEIDWVRAGDALMGRLKFPTQGAKTYEVQNLLIRDHSLSFSVVDDNKIPSFFDGTLSRDTAEITGKMTEQFNSYPFSLRRRETRPAQKDLLPPVLRVADDGAELRHAFNADAGHVRLLMILSPTSFFSRMTLRIVQRDVLDQIASPDLKVYVVWEPVFPSDSEQASFTVSHLVSDPRVQQFWSNSRFTGRSFGKLFGQQGKPVWDSFLIFTGDKRWTDATPVPDQFRIIPQPGMEAQADRKMNGMKLAEEIKTRLNASQVTPAKK
jgi:hypothetical protein